MTPGLIVFTAFWLIVIAGIVWSLYQTTREDRARRNRGTTPHPPAISTPDAPQIGPNSPPSKSNQEWDEVIQETQETRLLTIAQIALYCEEQPSSSMTESEEIIQATRVWGTDPMPTPTPTKEEPCEPDSRS